MNELYFDNLFSHIQALLAKCEAEVGAANDYKNNTLIEYDRLKKILEDASSSMNILAVNYEVWNWLIYTCQLPVFATILLSRLHSDITDRSWTRDDLRWAQITTRLRYRIMFLVLSTIVFAGNWSFLVIYASIRIHACYADNSSRWSSYLI